MQKQTNILGNRKELRESSHLCKLDILVVVLCVAVQQDGLDVKA